MKHQTAIELDIRVDLRLKKEPFDKIMGAVERGYIHETEPQDDGSYKITITKIGD